MPQLDYTPLEALAVYRELSEGARPYVRCWIEELIARSPRPSDGVVLAALDQITFGSGPRDPEVTEDQLEEIRHWMEASFEEDLLELISQCIRLHSAARVHPRATGQQIDIILDLQKEVGVSFSRPELEQLSSWQADVLIKGLVVVGETQRVTGSRQLPIRDLRHFVRNGLHERSLCSGPGHRPVPAR